MACKFQEEWIRRYDWIERVYGDDYQARCKLCWKKFSLKSMGVGAVKSHIAGKKHVLKQQVTGQNLKLFDRTASNSGAGASCSAGSMIRKMSLNIVEISL